MHEQWLAYHGVMDNFWLAAAWSLLPTVGVSIVFFFVVLGQLLVSDPWWARVLNVVGWLFWTVFVAEFLLRAYIARFRWAFWKRSWWQLLFLLLPFLRLASALRALRVVRVARLTRLARAGGIVSASVRGSRSAGTLLCSRIATLAAVTAVVAVAASQLLYAFGSHSDYATALYEASLATVTGSGITAADPLARILHVCLAIYSVVVFATLAGAVGAYLLGISASPQPQASPRARHEEADMLEEAAEDL